MLDDIVLVTMARDLGRVRRARADEAAVAVEQRAREVVGPAVAELQREAVEGELLPAGAVHERSEQAGVRAGGFAVDPSSGSAGEEGNGEGEKGAHQVTQWLAWFVF